MEINIQETQVQVRFKAETTHGRFQDALYYPPDVFAAKTEADILAEGQARADAWVAALEAPPVQPTEQDLQSAVADAEKTLAYLLDYRDVRLAADIATATQNLQTAKDALAKSNKGK